ncbi:chymotrypsin family serine protease [Corynebacterium hesseae]
MSLFTTAPSLSRRCRLLAVLSAAVLISSCSDTDAGPTANSESTKENSAGAEISEILAAPVSTSATTSGSISTSTVTTSQQQTLAEPPVQRTAIDPGNDPSGQSGRDDNRGIYYHNSVDWEWLKQPGGIVPGGRIVNETRNGTCSTGFLASRGERLFIITAGHCGKLGDQFYVQDAQNNWEYVGEMVESYLQEDAHGSIYGTDIGLIELLGDARYTSSLPLDLPMQGWITPQEAQRRNMMICRLGATTGYSCGEFESIGNGGLFYFRNISDRGDSGGAVFAIDNSGVWALGVSSNVSDSNKTLLGAMEIGSAINHWGLTIHG